MWIYGFVDVWFRQPPIPSGPILRQRAVNGEDSERTEWQMDRGKYKPTRTSIVFSPPHQHQFRFIHCTYFTFYTYNTLHQTLAGYFLSAYSQLGLYFPDTGPGGLCIPISTFTTSFAILLLQQSILTDYHYNIESCSQNAFLVHHPRRCVHCTVCYC